VGTLKAAPELELGFWSCTRNADRSAGPGILDLVLCIITRPNCRRYTMHHVYWNVHIREVIELDRVDYACV